MLFHPTGTLPFHRVATERLPQIKERLQVITTAVPKPSHLFWLCWAVILGGIVVRFPSLAANAEMFGENGANLYYHAKHHGIWDNLFEFDYYEYLFWFPRLVALVAVKGFHLRESYAFVTEWFGHLVTGFFYAFFCLARFRTILPSDLARFLVATALGLGLVGTYELYAFINFPYHGMFLMLILLFSSLNSRPVVETLSLTLLVFLVCTSKLHPVVFLPFYAVAAVLALRKTPEQPGSRWTPDAVFRTTTTVGMLLQAGATLAVITFWRTDWRGYTGANPVAELSDLGLYYFRTWLHLLFPNDFIDAEPLGLNWLAPWALPPLFAVLTALCLIHWSRGNRRVVAFFVVCNGLALLNLAVTLCTLSKVLEDNEWAAWFLPFQNRWFVLSLTALFVGTVVLVARMFRRPLTQAAITLVMIACAVASNRDFLTEYSHYITTPRESFSHWSLYARLTEEPDYAIPLNPHPWMLFHNSVPLGDIAATNGVCQLESGTGDVARVRSAVVLESDPRLEQPLRLIALDRDGHELATGRPLTPPEYQYPYFYFDAAPRAARFKLVDANGRAFAGAVTLRFVGPADAP